MEKAVQKTGPGYASPLEAMHNAPREKVLYVPCIQTKPDQPDYLATINVDPASPDYGKVISRLNCAVGAQLHHTGWNTCSSCHFNCNVKRDKLIVPGLRNSSIYVVDVTNEKSPVMHKVIDGKDMLAFDCSRPHTTHCTKDSIMISTLGDAKGNAKGDFVLIDPCTLEIKGTWIKGFDKPKYGYDFWYQPYFDIMVSSEWAAPNTYEPGFNPEDAAAGKYGQHLHFYSWQDRKLLRSVDMGSDGLTPLEIRFLHNPKKPIGFVGCALNGIVYRIYMRKNGTWNVKKAITVEQIGVKNWVSPKLPGLITDVLISMDDRFLYFSNWLQGDIRQYDISNPKHPKLVGQIYLGGKLVSDSPVTLDDSSFTGFPKQPMVIKGVRVQGGPQMIQLSLDGKRLYVTNSLFSTWDNGIYPDMFKNGSQLLKIDVNTEKGGMKVDKDFIVNFGAEPNGPVLAHEIRYPGGDCTSDIWLAEEYSSDSDSSGDEN